MENLRSSICSSCCFRRADVDPIALEHRRDHHHHHLRHNSADASTPRSLPQSPSYTRSNPPDHKARRRGLMSLLGAPSRHHRRGYSADFKYDPLSYALNFDEGQDVDGEGEMSPAGIPYRDFSSRLPPSPPPASKAEAVAVAK